MAITSNLDVAIIAQKAIAALKVKLPVLSAFSTDFGAGVSQKGVSVTVPLIGNKVADDFSGNYTTDASNNVSSTTVTLDQSTDSVTGLTDIEYADTGLQILSDYASEDMYAVSKVVVDYALGIVTVANYQREYTIAAASFVYGTVIALKAMAMSLGWDSGTIMLNPTAYASWLASYIGAVTFTPGQDPESTEFLGFRIIPYAAMPTSEALIGICCNPIALAVASRPVSVLPGAGAGTAQAVATDPDSGLSMGLRSYYSNDTGRQIQAVHQVHGASVGKEDALIRIVSSDQDNSSSSSVT